MDLGNTTYREVLQPNLFEEF